MPSSFRIDQARKLQALSRRKLAPRQRMIPASFSALGRASQAFADHQLGNIAAFRLQHTAVAATVAIEHAPSLPAFTRNYCEVEAATGNNLAQALRRLSCNGPLRCTARLKARLWCVESEQADLPSMAANHDGVAVLNLDCSRLDRVGGRSRGNARQGQGEEQCGGLHAARIAQMFFLNRRHAESSVSQLVTAGHRPRRRA
jgi:hypothetical protein